MSDAHWDQTVMLLHCEGANGSTDFFDSTYRNIPAANGNAQISTAHKKFGTSSIYLDGSGDYVTVPIKSNLILGASSEWTIELFFRAGSLTNRCLFALFKNSSNRISVEILDPTTIFLYGLSLTITTPTMQIGRWYHFAISRFEGVVRAFLDGVQCTGTTTNNIPAAIDSGYLSIGYTFTSGFEYWFSGHMDEVRITNGVARYTADFTPPAAPFEEGAVTRADDLPQYWSQTSLLLHCDGDNGSTYFRDERHNLITVNGNAQLSTAQKKLGTASLALDGVGDYLHVGSATPIGAGDFTVEFFFRLNQLGLSCFAFDCRTNGTDPNGFIFYPRATNKLAFWVGTAIAVEGVTPLVAGVWYHAALVRSAGVVKGYLNGSQEFSIANTVNFDRTVHYIGMDAQLTNNGGVFWLDEIRVTPGVARYTDRFVPPTKAFPGLSQGDSNWSNVILSLPFADRVGAQPTDLKGHAINQNGNAAFSTSAGKFHGSSMSFDGAGDYLTVTTGLSDFIFGTGDLTVEFWVRATVLESSTLFALVNGANKFEIYFNGATEIRSAIGGVGYVANFVHGLSAGVWYHFAISRQGNTWRSFINGALMNTVTASANLSWTPADFVIGGHAGYGLSAQDSLNGYMQGLRVTKGVARYTAAFTPPTEPFPTFVPQSLSGTVLDSSGNPIQRTVRSYERATGRLIGTAVSDPVTGVFSLPADNTDEHFVVVFDDAKNALVYDHIVPVL